MSKPKIMQDIGNTSQLETSGKDLVGAVNELNQNLDILNNDRGYLKSKKKNEISVLSIKENGKYVFSGNTITDIPINQGDSNLYVIANVTWSDGQFDSGIVELDYIYPTIGAKYINICLNSVWQGWKQIATTDTTDEIKNQSTLFVTETLNGSGDLNNYIKNCKVKIGKCIGVANTPITTDTGNNAVVEVFEGYGGVTQVYHAGNGKCSWIRYYASWSSPQWTDWKVVVTTTTIGDLTLLNGWTARYAKYLKVGNIVFIHISCSGGTGTQGTVICNIPYTPINDGYALDAYYRSSTSYEKTPCNIGARSNKQIRFSVTTQPSYNGTDILDITGFYYTNE